jgi:hypothetical protein
MREVTFGSLPTKERTSVNKRVAGVDDVGADDLAIADRHPLDVRFVQNARLADIQGQRRCLGGCNPRQEGQGKTHIRKQSRHVRP